MSPPVEMPLSLLFVDREKHCRARTNNTLKHATQRRRVMLDAQCEQWLVLRVVHKNAAARWVGAHMCVCLQHVVHTTLPCHLHRRWI
jgi:hypothetical protein